MKKPRNQLLLTTTALLTSLLMTNPAQAKMPAVVVSASTVTTTSWQPSIHLIGKLRARQGMVVSSEVPGRITEIYFHSGQRVQKGDRLFALNTAILSALKKQYEAEFVLSDLDLKRKKNLYQKQALSKAELDIATAHRQSNLAKVEQINAQIKQATVVAPFSGTLGLRQVSVGDYVSPGQPIVNCQSSDALYVDFNVPETVLSQLKKKQTLTVQSTGFTDESLSGNVDAFESVINPGSQTLSVRATLSKQKLKSPSEFNTKNTFIPGTFVNVTLYLGDKKSVVLVPQTAIMYSSKGDFIYKIKDKTAHKSKIILGRRTKNKVIVKKGLSAGEQIVTIGGMKLYDGAHVMLSPSTTNNTARQ